MKIFMYTFCLFLLFGCAIPVTSVRAVDTRPSISISGASELSDLYVDGIKIGRTKDYMEPNQLKLEAGTHRVSIVEAGKTIYEQKIFIESEHKTIIAR